jgi:hypothetical protein
LNWIKHYIVCFKLGSSLTPVINQGSSTGFWVPLVSCWCYLFHLFHFFLCLEVYLKQRLNMLVCENTGFITQARFIQKIYPSPLPYFKVNICPFPLPHFASIFFAYLWSFRWPNYIVTLPRYFSFRLPHLNIPTGPVSMTEK